MKLFLECAMGASGDMLMAALYELLQDKYAFRRKMENLKLPGVTYEYTGVQKCGVTGTHITVKVGGHAEHSEDVHTTGNSAHSHEGEDHAEHSREPENHEVHEHGYSYTEIVELIKTLELPENVKTDVLGVYEILGKAESQAHSVPLEKLHLHEVGALDAIADITGCCILVNMLGATDIMASPVRTGFGHVKIAHGTVPVPAPATARILTGIPIYAGDIKGELCTPTGAALIKYFAKSYGEMPLMTVSRMGCGMGTKDFDTANCLRAYLSEDSAHDGGGRDEVYEVSCNLDDMTPEAVGAAYDFLFGGGVLDVWVTPIYMKKNRPGFMLSCLCGQDSLKKISRLMLEHTTTLGVRIKSCRREILSRANLTVSTEYGEIRVKTASGYGVYKQKPEYGDVLAAARRAGVPFQTVFEAAVAAGGKERLPFVEEK